MFFVVYVIPRELWENQKEVIAAAAWTAFRSKVRDNRKILDLSLRDSYPLALLGGYYESNFGTIKDDRHPELIAFTVFVEFARSFEIHRKSYFDIQRFLTKSLNQSVF